MRRAVYAFAGTAAGTALLIATKLGPRPVPENVELGLSGPSAAPSLEAPASPSRPPAPVTSAKPTTQPPATQAPPPPPAGDLRIGTFPGPGVAAGRYGTIKVTIVVSGGRITDVTAVYPTGGHSGSINQRTIPRLRQQALTAQSANISTISGATYTSNAYKQSLQAAINAAK